MRFDLDRALRRWKAGQRATRPTQPPPPAALPLAADAPAMGGPLLLDSCVTIDVLQGKTPAAVDELLRRRVLLHSTVALGELTHLFGRLDPRDARTKSVLALVAATINDIPSHRLAAPSAQAYGEAGILAGLVMRLFGDGREAPALHLNDALIFLQAQEQGASVLTRNTRDFGRFLALAPKGRILFYEAESATPRADR